MNMPVSVSQRFFYVLYAAYLKFSLLKDKRILDLNRIVEEVKQSEEWEAVKMNILEIGFEQGKELGIKQGEKYGSREMLIKTVEAAMKNFDVDLHKACEGLGVSVAEYEEAKRQCI